VTVKIESATTGPPATISMLIVLLQTIRSQAYCHKIIS
jgi:hypothetical protein